MKIVEKYLNKIKELAKKIERDVKLMEVCGTHTQVIARYGIKNSLPDNIKLVSGPGCPVCVTAKKDIDAVVALALSGVSIATYGDVMRVRGNGISLAEARERGADVRAVYGVEDLFKISFRHKDFGKQWQGEHLNVSSGFQTRDLVFFGIGFETTAPMSASAVKRGLMLYSAHKAFIPAMRALLGNGEIKVDGLISPGHVAAITGSEVFRGFHIPDLCKSKKMAEHCREEANPASMRSEHLFYKHIPQVITGFELEDVLKAIMMLLRQILSGQAETENEYSRVVTQQGNIKALKLIDEVFETEDSDWRGLGIIPRSEFKLRKEFSALDAKIIYEKIIEKIPLYPPLAKGEIKCLCSSVIKGLSEPQNCSLFGKICNPENPQGPCMVSVEGSCCVAYKNQLE